jgi:hypothetical protein
LFHWGRVQTHSLVAFHTQMKRVPDAFRGKKYLHGSTVDNRTDTPECLMVAHKKAKGHEPIIVLAEFQNLLHKYSSYAELNRREEALGRETWPLNIASSVLENINNETLELLLRLSQQNTLFFRDFKLPVLPFLQLYAKQRDLTDDSLCPLIVSIAISSACLLTAPPGEKNLIQVYEKETIVDIELDRRRWRALISAFDNARDAYGYSSLFVPDA